MAQIPFGIAALAILFAFGTLMSGLACVALLFPGGALEAIWRLNPQARDALEGIGPWAIALMGAVSAACALSARGLLTRSLWGYRLSLAVLVVNLVGDIANAVLRNDLRTLIGLPIGGLLIAYLLRTRTKRLFVPAVGAASGRSRIS